MVAKKMAKNIMSLLNWHSFVTPKEQISDRNLNGPLNSESSFEKVKSAGNLLAESMINEKVPTGMRFSSRMKVMLFEE